MKKRRSPKRVHPKTMVTRFKEVFKTTGIKKTSLRNLLLTVIAVSVARTFRINEIASRLPLAVKNEKSKQKRLLRFLETPFAIQTAQQAWGRFVLQRLWHAKPYKHPLLLVDETDLHGEWKAIVAAVAFRNRAIPIYGWVYRNAELRDATYKSHNELIQLFCLRTYQLACEVFADQKQKPVFVFDRGFARAKYVIEYLKDQAIACVMRVPRNVCVLTRDGWKPVDALPTGFQVLRCALSEDTSHPRFTFRRERRKLR